MELARQRAELARVKMERDILKKATAYFATVAVSTGTGLGIVLVVCAEPATHKFPAESKAAAVATSFDPLSSGTDHCTVPLESKA